MKTLGKLAWGILTAVLLLCVTAVADPPDRVVRLQYMSGDVSMQPGGVNEWVPGVMNRPMTTADRLWTDKQARAELQLGSAALRVSAETSLTLTNISDETVQVELDQGTLNLRINHLYHGEIYEVDTPNMAFTVTKSGEYRFDVDPNGDTTLVTVWHGQGEATGQGRAVKIKQNHQARFTAGTSLSHQMFDSPRPDGFDDWCRVRDDREDHSLSARYVSPQVVGAEDLDDYGTWRVVPTYGAIWMPTVAPGWAPYHYGHWIWLDPWGWTWVDDAPWGFAPCHYGRWVYYGQSWGWVPGPVAVRPVYAPALVAWVGGSHWGVSVSFGGGTGVGWFPLGYGEPYLPSYPVSRNYFHNVNVSNTRITNITNVTNNYYTTNNINSNNVNSNNTSITNNTTNNTTNNNLTINGDHNNVHIQYANRAVPGAVTAVPQTVLTGSQPVAKDAVKLSDKELKDASLEDGPRVTPSRNSVLGLHSGTRISGPPDRVVTRPVVAKLPAPPKPLPFDATQEALKNNPGRPLDRDAEQQIRTRIAHQPMKAKEDLPATRPADSSPTGMSTPPVTAPPVQEKVQEKAAESPTSAPVHNVPRPGDRRQVEKAVSNEKSAPHSPQGEPAQNAQTPQAQDHAVPRPPDRSRTEKEVSTKDVSTPAEIPAPDSHASMPAPDTDASHAQDHAVPRPPDRQAEKKPSPTGNPASHPSNPRPGSSTDTPSAQENAVPRPPDHFAPQAAKPLPVADSAGRPVPQPAVSRTTSDAPHTQPATEPRHADAPPNTSHSEPATNHPSDSSPQPAPRSPAPRSSASRSNASQSNDGGTQPQAAAPAKQSTPNQASGAQPQKSAPAPSSPADNQKSTQHNQPPQ